MPEKKLNLIYLDQNDDLHDLFERSARLITPNDFGAFHSFSNGIQFLNTLQEEQIKESILVFDFGTMATLMMDLKRLGMDAKIRGAYGQNTSLDVSADGTEMYFFNLLKIRYQILGTLMVSGSRGAANEEDSGYWKFCSEIAKGRFIQKPYNIGYLRLFIEEILEETKRFRI